MDTAAASSDLLDAATPGGVIWRPQVGPQMALVTCPIADAFFGGARGGGKTEALLGDYALHANRHGKYAVGAFFRRSYPELQKIISRAYELLIPLGFRPTEGGRYWKSRTGAALLMRYLDNDKDASNYWGHEFTWLGLDELVNWPNPEPIDTLRACLRSSHGVPCVLRASGMPGGPGHNWVKARYIDPAPPFTPFQATLSDGSTIWRVYIPARLEDNRKLIEADPTYWQRIVAAVGNNAALLRAWREGEWNIVAGGFFDDVWNAPVTLPDGRVVPAHRIVIPSFDPPASWRVTRSFDWGSARPYSVGYWGVSDGTPAEIHGHVVHFARGSLVRLCELYGWNGVEPNKGVHATVTDIVREMRKIETARGWVNRVRPGPADPAIFATQNGMSIAQDFQRTGVVWVAADMNREGPLRSARANGWARMRAMLQAATQWPMERPGLFVTDACQQFIRTIPTLPRDGTHLEDVDTDAEDHIADETRYMITTPTAAGVTIKQSRGM